MNADVILSLLNELRKSDKMRGLRSILSLFRNELNLFNNTGVRMLDSIYQVTLKTALKSQFWRENEIICHIFGNVKMDINTLPYQICKPLYYITVFKISFGEIYRRIYGRKFSLQTEP